MSGNDPLRSMPMTSLASFPKQQNGAALLLMMLVVIVVASLTVVLVAFIFRERRSEMAAAAANVERAEWAVQRAYAEAVPNLDVQAVVQSDRATNSSNANLQVTMPIPWLDHNQGGIRQAEAELDREGI